MIGGLLLGLRTTLRNLTRRSVTAHYPDALPELPRLGKR
jgi:NADH-quinone oxidoreductase subunit I